MFRIQLSLKQLTPIERYALHYLEYLHVSDDEATLKVRDLSCCGVYLQRFCVEVNDFKNPHGVSGLFIITTVD